MALVSKLLKSIIGDENVVNYFYYKWLTDGAHANHFSVFKYC